MNITLIGMSGAGKSFVGGILAKRLGYSFIDTDKLIEGKHGMELQSVLDTLGEEKFLEEEALQISKLKDIENTIVAPGGSIVYSQDAAALLKSISKVVYLSASAEFIEQRVDTTSRGIVGLKDKTFRQLYEERRALYEQMADHTIAVEGKTGEAIAEEILALLGIPL